MEMDTRRAQLMAEQAVSAFGASQNAGELADAIHMIAKIDPRVIVEVGCDRGGTLYCWRQICDRVYGITLPDNGFSTGGSGQSLMDFGASVLRGDSHSLTSLQWLMSQLDGHKIDVLVIDGDHTVEGLYADVKMYAPLVRRGGIILLHDIAVTTDARAMVWKVWPEFRTADLYDTDEIVGKHAPLGWGVIYVHGGEPWD